MIEFETERLKLRLWSERDRVPFSEMNADPEVMRYFPAPLSEEQSAGLMDRIETHFSDHGWGLWAVEIRETSEFAGFIGLSIPSAELPFLPCVEIGWRLKRQVWGKGYATEGAVECLRVGFEVIGFDEIVSFTAVVNQRSVAVMERIGLVNTASDFDHPSLPAGHLLRRHCLYRATKQSWRASSPRYAANIDL